MQGEKKMENKDDRRAVDAVGAVGAVDAVGAVGAVECSRARYAVERSSRKRGSRVAVYCALPGRPR